MGVGVPLAGTAELNRRKAVQSELERVKRLLPGEDQRRANALGSKRPRKGRQLDRFRSGANDQPDIEYVQPSP
jgi:hypothetical protein